MKTSVFFGTFIAAIALLTSNVEAKPVNQENDMKTYKALREGEEAPVDAIGLDQLPDTTGLLRVFRTVCEPIAGGTSCKSSQVCEQNVSISTWSVPRPYGPYFYLYSPGWTCETKSEDGDFVLFSDIIYNRFGPHVTISLSGNRISESVVQEVNSSSVNIDTNDKIPSVQLTTVFKMKEKPSVFYSFSLYVYETLIQP